MVARATSSSASGPTLAAWLRHSRSAVFAVVCAYVADRDVLAGRRRRSSVRRPLPASPARSAARCERSTAASCSSSRSVSPCESRRTRFRRVAGSRMSGRHASDPRGGQRSELVCVSTNCTIERALRARTRSRATRGTVRDRVRRRHQGLPRRDDRGRRTEPLQIPDNAITVLRRTVRLRQDHLAADDQPDDRRRPRARSGSTARTSPATTSCKLRRGIGYVIQHAGLFPHRTVVDNVATVPVLSGVSRREARSRGARAARAGRPRPRARRPLPGAALRRPAAARRRRPGAGRRPAGDADGRAVLGRRPGRARRPAAGVPAAAGRPRQDHRDRHPRHRRGDQARRPGRGLRRGRSAGAARPRPRSCSPHRPTTSSPGSSVATAASADSRSARPPTSRSSRSTPRSTACCSSSTPTAGRRAGSRPTGTLPTEGTWTVSDNLRIVTDLVILSPAGAAVRVDADGRADGVVRHAALAEHIRRAPGRATG